MIFQYPLVRTGFYYMSKETYQSIMEDETDRILFAQQMSLLSAKVKELKDFYLITIKKKAK